ncbi:MAG: sulfatase-like hydrolase/transferase, partial [Planctomycetes bacterium]|nr:sulfatase-like hydrolase/transferase [Planctomycetota bacterium]
MLLILPVHSFASQPNAKPNIIIFITDDQSPFSWDYKGDVSAIAFGFNGEKRAYSPEIDRLAREGMIFTAAYVSSSVCTPSRYTTLTGRYAGRCEGTVFMRLHPEGTMTRVENNTELEDDK